MRCDVIRRGIDVPSVTNIIQMEMATNVVSLHPASHAFFVRNALLEAVVVDAS